MTLSAQPNTVSDAASPELSLRFWIAVAMTGVFSGFAGGAMMRLLFWIERWAWSEHGGDFLHAVTQSTALHRIVCLALAGVLVGVIGTLLRRVYGRAGGDVDGAIWFRNGNVPFVPTIAKAILSIVSVGLGSSLGRESPIKQLGGAIAAAMARATGLVPQQQKLLVACGVGAGMASAYNVPLGGAIFAVEVLIGSISLSLVLPALLASLIATAASWIFLPNVPVYTIPELSMSVPLMVWSLIAGPIFGLTAVAIVRAVAWAETYRPQQQTKDAVWLPIVVLTSLGTVAIAFPQLLGNGKDTVQLAFTNPFSFRLLITLSILKLLATAACLRSGASGGVFTPTMAIGALLGGAMGVAWSIVWPGAAVGSYAVVGASAVLAAATQGPVSALVLVLELTRRADATMVPLLLATIGATLIARRFEPRSIYSARAARDG